MIPTKDEIQSIVEATQQTPDKELGPAESLLLTMSSITELEPRLKLWAFKLDYDSREKVKYYSGLYHNGGRYSGQFDEGKWCHLHTLRRAI